MWKRTTIIVALALAAAAGSFGLADYRADLVAISVCFGLLALSADICVGYTGVTNFAPMIPFGFGAYSVGLAHLHDVSILVSLPLGLVASSLVAVALSWLVLRRQESSLHFGVVCLGLSLALEQAGVGLYKTTGGSNGVAGIPRPFVVSDPQLYCAVTTLAASAITIAAIAVIRSHFGAVIAMIRFSPQRAEMLGYDVLAFRTGAILFSWAVAFIAGALYAPVAGTVTPGSMFGVVPNVLVLVWIALGGLATLLGPLICAILLKQIESELGARFYSWHVLILGLLLIIQGQLVPQGFGGLVAWLRVPAGDARRGANSWQS